MLERGVLVIGLAVVVLALTLAARAIARRRAAAVEGRALPISLQQRFAGRAPGIVYFYGPHCGTCRQQAAILESLSREDGVAVVRLDATSERALADALAVMTVPTTVIVDGVRNVRAINRGLRSREALAAQLRDLAGLAITAA